ncbi:MAG: CHAP domain-containing protein [Enterobacterales bacterium]|nr:CHAP domain-containing protein [Enterobacterales bacterium]
MLATKYTFIIVILFAFMPSSSIFAQANTPIILNLPHTDGDGLAVKLQPLAKEEQKRLFEKGLKSCENQCVTPFAQRLGQADGVNALSNCRSSCIKPQFSFLNLTSGEVVTGDKNPNEAEFHYIGLIYQCVEYARKWWMINQDITFGSIDSAYEILYLTEGKNIRTNQTFPLARSLNGSAKRPPKRGDLLIYAADRNRANWRHGHVAVVVEVDLANNYLLVAEENYNNQPWADANKYARKLKLSHSDKGYQVIDQDPYQLDTAELGVISGWIYPMQVTD